MTIALLMSTGSPQSRDIATQIAGLGHEIHIIDAVNVGFASYINRDDPHQQESIRALAQEAKSVHAISYREKWGLGALTLARCLAKILRDVDADVLLTIHGGAYSAAAYLSRSRPYAVYVGGTDVLFARGAKKFLSRLSLHSASIVFANGRYLASKTEELAPRATVLPLYMGTDTEQFRPGNRPKSPISIVCTRGFLPIYNNEQIIRALAQLPQSLPEYRVIFAAGGPDLERAGALAKELLTPAQFERVSFLGGVSRRVLSEILSTAHVYASVSLSDGTSLSLMEAMACGAFPILSDIPANREWLDESKTNALLVPFDDPAKLANALTKAIKDERLRSDAAAYNRQLIVERADLKSNMKTMLRELIRYSGRGRLFENTRESSHLHPD